MSRSTPIIGMLLLLALATGCAGTSEAGPWTPGPSGGPLLPEQGAIDVEHYELRLDIDPETRTLEGRLEMTARVLEPTHKVTMHLDQALEVRSLAVQGVTRDFVHADGMIIAVLNGAMHAGETMHVAVEYGGAPRPAPRAPWDGGFTWSETVDGTPWFTTTCQGEGADVWWPCKDHPSDKPGTMDLFITVPEPLVVASNGTLQSVESRGDGTHTYHWHIASPIGNYNVALNVGPFERIDETYTSVTGEDFPVHFWVLPESLEQGKAFMPEILDHLRWFEETLGPYPFRAEKYGVVETPHLGMEHQSIIAYGNQFRKAEPDYDWLHHHELAHEWWGNLVSCSDWKDMWIHEGFGTYMQAMYIQDRFGDEAYRDEMETKRQGLVNKRAVAPREIRNSKQIYFAPDGTHDNDIYSKGSWILHTLRWYMGDEDFRRFLRLMVYPDERMAAATDGSQVRFVDTEDVRAVAEEVSGEDLSWFFEVYLRQPELPELIVSRTRENLELRWKVPEGLRFPMPVPLQLGDKRVKVLMPSGGATVPVGDVELHIDPDEQVLKRRARLVVDEQPTP